MTKKIRSRDPKGRFIKVRKNGEHQIDAQSTMRVPIGLSRIIQPQAAYRWLAPGIASYTPRRIETILNGALAGDHVTQWQLFDLMLDTWPVLSACQQELLYGVIRRDLVFDPYAAEDEKPTADAIDREKLVTAAIRSMAPDPTRDDNAIDGTIKDLMNAWFMGTSVLEILWQIVDTPKAGTIRAPQSTAWVHPQNYGFDQDGKLGLALDKPITYGTSVYPPRQQPLVTPPPNKFLIAIHKTHSGSALGGALLRPLAWWWCATNFTSDWLLNLAQVFGLPFRWANYAASAPEQTVNAICNMLQNMGSAGWAAFPEGTTLELKEASTGSGGHTPQGDLLDRADSYARLTILGQTLTGQTIASGRGGQSFGTVEAQLKQDRLDAACAFVAGIINRQLIPAILDLNYGETSDPPKCRFLQEAEGTYQDAQRDQILTGLDVPIPLSHIRHKYNIPEPTGDEPVTQPAKPVAPSSVSAGPIGTRPIGQAPKNPAPNPKEVQARLEKISLIEDDAVFARELTELAEEIYHA
jgi:phage gp29-like protein